MLILFLVIILIMLLLFVMMFVVVVFMLLMVTFWCVESLRLCVIVFGRMECWCVDVVLVVYHVVLIVVIVVIGCCCDGVVYGKLLEVIRDGLGRMHLGLLLLSWLCYCG